MDYHPLHDFITGVAGEFPAGSDEAIIVGPRKGLGGPIAQWRNEPHQYEDGLYFCISSVKWNGQLGQRLRRRKVDLVRTYCIVLDDVGTKVDPAKITVEPSWKIETSAGNYQWGYKLSPACPDPEVAAQFVDELIAAGLSDQGAKGAYRLARVPGSRHKSGWRARLTEWHPERSWSLDELRAEFALTPPQVSTGEVEDTDWDTELTLQTIAELLPYISDLPDDGANYNRWIQVGMAIHHECGGAEIGLDIWETWSTTRRQWEEGACAKKWETFGGYDGTPVTLGTLRNLAGEGGWRPNRRAGTRSGKPVIFVNQGEGAAAIRAAIAALAAVNPPLIYRRGGTLAQVVHLEEPEQLDGHTVIPTGTTILHQPTAAGIMLPLSDVADYCVMTDQGPHAKDPPARVCAGILGAPAEWGRLPPLSGVTAAPLMDSAGNVHDIPGYHPESRLYYDGSAPALILPDTPDRLDAELAAIELLAPFEEFAFGDKEVAQSVVLGYILTLATRWAYPTAPLFAIDATAPGAGKGLLVEVCNTIVRGRDAAITLPPSGLGEDDEWRKRITAILLAGMDSVLIDNVESAVGNKSLNGLLTSDVWTDRILGRSETVSLPARVTWAATGNGLVVRGDQVRRTVMLCIDPGVERPEQRRFKRDLAIWVPANRQRLLSAAMTILRAYRRAGCPGQDDVLLGRFEPWSRTVCGPIRWLGMPDPTASQVELVAEDPEMERLADVHSVLSEWFGEQPFSVADVGKVLSDDFADVGKAPGLKDALREALAVVAGGSGPGGISTKRLGWYLRHFAGRVIAGRKLVRLDQFHKPHYLVAAAAEG